MRRRARVRFLTSGAVGTAFFLLPVRVGDQWTVPFDVAVEWLTGSFPGGVGLYCLLAIVGGAGLSAAAALRRPAGDDWLDRFRTRPALLTLRLLGAPLAVAFYFGVGPELVLQQRVSELMWGTLAYSVGVIIPVGAAFLELFVRYGFLEFVGTLMRPVMRPLFRLPGRSALDSLTSWVGSYSVGLYLTRQLLLEGYYTKREAYTIATCFSTVSIGFVAVVAQTLELLRLFPLIFLSYCVLVYLLGALLVRTWPIVRVPDEYVGEPRPEAEDDGAGAAAFPGDSPRAAGAGGREDGDEAPAAPGEPDGGAGLARRAWRRAVRKAEGAPPPAAALGRGLADGLVLASTILGSILAVGTAALLLARETPVFQLLGQPLVPVLSLLGIPDAATVGPAVLVGITEMYIPALLTADAAAPARFFVAVLSVSQLIFFSSLGPMVLDMFREIPVRARELVALFFIRTAVLVPLLAGLTALLRWAGAL